MTELLAWIGGLTAFLAAVAAFARWVVRPAWRMLAAVQQFLDQWFGTDDQPGVVDRVTHIEWHVGNGAPDPLRKVVDQTQQTLAEHLAWSEEQARDLAALRSGEDEKGEQDDDR